MNKLLAIPAIVLALGLLGCANGLGDAPEHNVLETQRSELEAQEDWSGAEKKRTALLVAKLEARLDALEAELRGATEEAASEAIEARLDKTRTDLKEARIAYHKARLWEGNSTLGKARQDPFAPPMSD